MDFAILVKAVPRSETVRYDTATRRMVRSGTDLVLNPFDQRALRVALELRRPGESVSVVSMGPPEAEVPLRAVRSLGADRVLLLSDPALAGSDILATARALARGLRRVGHEMVLAGSRSTDSETGQVGPEVAALLGIPVLTGARSVQRDLAGSGFSIVVDTAVGWTSYHALAPLLVTVGEKIGKPLKPPSEYIPAAPGPDVERVSVEALGIDPAHVGDRGSPTVVGLVAEAAPRRSPRLFATGTIEGRVRAAALEVRRLYSRPAEESPPYPSAPALLSDEKEVLVLVTDQEGAIQPLALGILSGLRRSLPGHWPSAVWVGRSPDPVATSQVHRAGAVRGYFVRIDDRRVDSRAIALAVHSVLEVRPQASALVFLSDPLGREVAGQIAASRGLGLIADAVSVAPDPDHGTVWSKPSFGGRTLAQIYCRTRPVVGTVRPGAFGQTSESVPTGDLAWEKFSAVQPRSPVEWAADGWETEGIAELSGRDVIVAVGMGVAGPEGIARVRASVARWGAGVVATRRVVDMGWMPPQLQVGLTGGSLTPRLAVLLGVSGSANHMYGWACAPTLLAVNQDPNAPVFRDVDVGIVGSLEEVLPPLVEALAPILTPSTTGPVRQPDPELGRGRSGGSV